MRKTLNKFTSQDSYTWNITHTTESTAVWNSEAWAMGITALSRGEVPGNKGLWRGYVYTAKCALNPFWATKDCINY
jgi:hypothetical protein